MSNRPPLLLFSVNNPKMNQQNIRQFSYPILLISLLLMAIQSSQAGSYELSAEMSSSELQSGKRMSPYVSYQPWSYMKRAPTAPIIRFGKRSSESAEWGEPTPIRNIRATFVDPLIRFGKRVPSGAPLIRFGRRPAEGAPLIRFGKRAGAPLIRFGKRTPKIE